MVAHTVRNLPVMLETPVQSLGQEDPLEKEMATHSSILAWRIPWTEEPGGLYSPWGCKKLDKTEQLSIQYCKERKRVLELKSELCSSSNSAVSSVIWES